MTITQYTVTYTRADGHNVQGVDVPYAFTAPATVPSSPPAARGRSGSSSSDIDRETGVAARGAGQQRRHIVTIANVTFYGADLVGNAVSVTGQS